MFNFVLIKQHNVVVNIRDIKGIEIVTRNVENDTIRITTSERAYDIVCDNAQHAQAEINDFLGTVGTVKI